MPWRDGRYYRAYRQNGRPRNEYVGKGPVAFAAAALDDQARQRRALEKALLEMDRASAEAADDLMCLLNDAADLLVRVAMAAAGYHRHDRSNWRKRRER